MRYSISDQ